VCLMRRCFSSGKLQVPPMGHQLFVVGGLCVQRKLGAKPVGELAGQTLAEEPDEVCPTTTIGQAGLFWRGEANPPMGVNPDRRSRPSRLGGCAEGW
jgi:hypothetical protein